MVINRFIQCSLFLAGSGAFLLVSRTGLIEEGAQHAVAVFCAVQVLVWNFSLFVYETIWERHLDDLTAALNRYQALPIIVDPNARNAPQNQLVIPNGA